MTKPKARVVHDFRNDDRLPWLALVQTEKRGRRRKLRFASLEEAEKELDISLFSAKEVAQVSYAKRDYRVHVSNDSWNVR